VKEKLPYACAVTKKEEIFGMSRLTENEISYESLFFRRVNVFVYSFTLTGVAAAACNIGMAENAKKHIKVKVTNFLFLICLLF
jgi:hypothetical protein